MASTDLRDRLTCSICMDVYPDPATLTCGHSFCRVCLTRRTREDEEEKVYFCPECKAEAEPTAFLGNTTIRSLAKPSEDSACVCEPETSKIKTEELGNVLEKLVSRREEEEKERVQSLRKHKVKVAEKATGEAKRVTVLFGDIRRQLDILEKRVLGEISRKNERVSRSVSGLIHHMEVMKDEVSRKIRHIEELSTMADPMTKEADGDDLCCVMDRATLDKGIDLHGLDEGLISETFLTHLSDIETDIKNMIHVKESSDILLDVRTADNSVDVSYDCKTASTSDRTQLRPETPARFTSNQVLSTRRFSSGRHYWEVETSKSRFWKVGIAYPSIERKGYPSLLGYNDKSWCLYKTHDDLYAVRHDSRDVLLPYRVSCQRLGIYLDYEAGRLSLYEQCDPIRHLYTFTGTFTEPLHAAFTVWSDSWVTIKN